MTLSQGDIKSGVDGPLSGVTVLDLTRVLAGPYCTMVLSDLGARVIKVERPETGDDSRAYGPFLKGQSAYFASLNRGKESIALDLKRDDDRKIFEKLVAQSDVLVENYRPGTMEKLGYGWDALHERYPKLIYAAASGFGHSGPYRTRAAYDMVVQAMGGIMSVTGHPGQPPVRVGTSVGDITAGLFTAIGVNAALLHRATTGDATKVDVSMLDCQVAILENAIARYVATGEVAGPIGARHPAITPFAAFEASDGWLVIAAGNDALFAKLSETIGCPGLPSDPRFTTNGDRTENWEPLFAELNVALTARSVDDWLELLDAAGVPSGPINAVDQVLSDPQILSRNMVVESYDPDIGTLKMAGNPIKFDAFTDRTVRTPAPKLDADRDALLSELTDDEGDVTNLPAVVSMNDDATSEVEVTERGRLAFLTSTSSQSMPSLRYLDQFGLLFSRLTELGAGIVSRDDPFIDQARKLADALISQRGEVLGTAIAVEFVDLMGRADLDERLQFLELLATEYGPDIDVLSAAVDAWRTDQSDKNLAALTRAAEAPRQELFRRTNMAPGGTQFLVTLRTQLLSALKSKPELRGVDDDLRHLFGSWFNRGFLELRRIDWNTPASVLEKLIAYEAVHSIDGWDDLRRRLASDRRCFGFFHPALPDEPLIFVEVALVKELSERIDPIIRAPMPAPYDGNKVAQSADTAIFYSISNCQPGLRGIAFGNFLIKQVATDLAQELPNLKMFVTLSPIPGLRRFIEDEANDPAEHAPTAAAVKAQEMAGTTNLRAAISRLAEHVEDHGFETPEGLALKAVLLPIAARYLTGEGADKGPRDPVARFHLGNGARVERVNWVADLSPTGLTNAYGLMVNYLYDLNAIAKNHEAFANRQPVARSKSVAEQTVVEDTGFLNAARDLIPIKR